MSKVISRPFQSACVEWIREIESAYFQELVNHGDKLASADKLAFRLGQDVRRFIYGNKNIREAMLGVSLRHFSDRAHATFGDAHIPHATRARWQSITAMWAHSLFNTIETAGWDTETAGYVAYNCEKVIVNRIIVDYLI